MIDILSGFLEATVRSSCPILLAALGAMFASRSGIINFAMEGIMVMGAFFGVYGSYLFGSPWIGLAMGIVAGVIAALVLGFVSITARVNQVVAGIGINSLFLGLTSYLLKMMYVEPPASVAAFDYLHIEGLSNIPVLGVLFSQQLLTYVAFLLVPVCAYIMNSTSFGMSLRSVGEQPHAADSLGINVNRMRYIAILISGVLGGVAGTALSLGQLSMFSEGMIAGRGYLAWSAVTVGKWSPVGIMLASLLFGGASSVQVRLQAMGINIPYHFFSMLPYVITMIVMVSVVGRTEAPKAIGKPFQKGER
ncbi:MAG: ABC transporter permease [Bacillota bacterium]